MEDKVTIAVSRLWHRRSKNEYFCARQLLETFPNLHFEFHIVLHDYEHRDEWTEKIESLDNKNVDFNWYSLSDMNNFMKDNGYVIDGDITKFVESKGHHMQFYHILIGLYLAQKGYKYMLTYEYDILFNEDRDISELREYLENKIPFGLSEPFNQWCDKALGNSIGEIYGTDISPYITRNNPELRGINSGFMGVNLNLFNDLLDKDVFENFFKIFNFNNSDHLEKGEKMIQDTQEQSFYGLMNQIHSDDFRILTPEKYFIMPHWNDCELADTEEEGEKMGPSHLRPLLGESLKSGVMHFMGYRKHIHLYETMDKKIEEWDKYDNN